MSDSGPEFAVRRVTSLIEAAVNAYREADDSDEVSRAQRLDRAMIDFREALLAWGSRAEKWSASEDIADNRLRWAINVMGAALLAYETYRGQREPDGEAFERGAMELDRRIQHLASALDLWDPS
jgi:hypothetical protein